ncbi:energy transducer TonB [Rufibacter hautae]|uniref:TonB family protein n=1 Tax=Rufibacter hautae TaxID=2595005 RepID=A0A5B6TVC8_9BACT|nr:energy transducer TonB [Rufibacter hautae]KAA3440508.1 TonB family protein [Rufibacter hautae]
MKKVLLAMLLWLCGAATGFCQTDTVIYLNSNFAPAPKNKALYYRVERYTDLAKIQGYKRDFYLTGEKYQEVYFSKMDSVKEGPNTVWHKNGKVKSVDHYVHNKLQGKSEGWFEDGEVQYEYNYDKNELHGEVKSYHANRQLRRKDLFSEGKLVEGHCYDENGTEVPHYPHSVMPEFPGGIQAMFKFVGQSVRIPFGMRLVGAEGIALVNFIVDKSGKISEVEVIRATHEKLGKECVRVVKSMPRWTPGQQEGEKVAVRYTIPIRIKLAD